jgi:hypothetical protein
MSDDNVYEFDPSKTRKSKKRGDGEGGGDGDNDQLVPLKQADQLIQLASVAELFHTPDSTGYADITIAGHRETWPIKSRGFRQWLAKRFYDESGGAPSSEALTSALNVIEAKARFDGIERTIFVRVGSADGKVYLDLGDESWRAIEISKHGWCLVSNPPVRFRRSAGMLPLPVPTRRGFRQHAAQVPQRQLGRRFCVSGLLGVGSAP